MFVGGCLALLVAPGAAPAQADLCGMPIPPEALEHAAAELAAYRLQPTPENRKAALLKLFAPETGLAWQAVPFAARPPGCPTS